MTMILGFSGRARHGKTECCEAIRVEALNHVPVLTAKIYDIGNMIRLHCIEAGLLPQVERKDMTKDQLQVLIDIGRERRQFCGEGAWINGMFNQIEKDNLDVALIPNLRYANEAKKLRDAGGYVVRCTRLNKNGSVYISPDRDPNDVSETELQYWPADFYFTLADGHVDLLRRQAVQLFLYLRGFNGKS